MNKTNIFLMTITFQDLKTEVIRELKVRQRVYPNWIEQGKISKSTADYRILCFERLALELELMIKAKSPQCNLFEQSNNETEVE